MPLEWGSVSCHPENPNRADDPGLCGIFSNLTLSSSWLSYWSVMITWEVGNQLQWTDEKTEATKRIKGLIKDTLGGAGFSRTSSQGPGLGVSAPHHLLQFVTDMGPPVTSQLLPLPPEVRLVRPSLSEQFGFRWKTRNFCPEPPNGKRVTRREKNPSETEGRLAMFFWESSVKTNTCLGDTLCQTMC